MGREHATQGRAPLHRHCPVSVEAAHKQGWKIPSSAVRMAGGFKVKF